MDILIRLQLKKTDNGLELKIPRSLCDSLDLIEDQKMELEILSDGFLLRKARTKYTLEELLAECDFSSPVNEDVPE